MMSVLEIPGGQTVAVCSGPSGSGRNAGAPLCRFYDLPAASGASPSTAGTSRVTQDNTAPRHRQKLPQDTVLFNDTIGYSIAATTARALSPAEVGAAATRRATSRLHRRAWPGPRDGGARARRWLSGGEAAGGDRAHAAGRTRRSDQSARRPRRWTRTNEARRSGPSSQRRTRARPPLVIAVRTDSAPWSSAPASSLQARPHHRKQTPRRAAGAGRCLRPDAACCSGRAATAQPDRARHKRAGRMHCRCRASSSLADARRDSWRSDCITSSHSGAFDWPGRVRPPISPDAAAASKAPVGRQQHP